VPTALTFAFDAITRRRIEAVELVAFPPARVVARYAAG